MTTDTVHSPGPGDPFLYIYKLRSGAGPEYDRRHREVWPLIYPLLDEAGIYDYQIWRRDDLVVSRMRTRTGFDVANAILSLSEVQREWTAFLSDLFEAITDEASEPLWLHEVFNYGTQYEGEPS